MNFNSTVQKYVARGYWYVSGRPASWREDRDQLANVIFLEVFRQKKIAKTSYAREDYFRT